MKSGSASASEPKSPELDKKKQTSPEPPRKNMNDSLTGDVTNVKSPPSERRSMLVSMQNLKRGISMKAISLGETVRDQVSLKSNRKKNFNF